MIKMECDILIIIDAGHGGFDPGGGSNEYFKEKDINLLISIYEANRLNELGIKTNLVRDSDITLTPGNRISKISSFNPKPNDILISNHVNTGNDYGGEVIYSIRGNDTLPKLIARNLSNVGLRIRNVYQKRNQYKKDYYFVLRETIPNDALIIEYGFASSDTDTALIRYSWPKLAEAVVKAIAEYLKVQYTKPKYTTYIVKENDTLYNIAKEYNTTVDQIKKDNSLSSNLIKPSDILIIS